METLAVLAGLVGATFIGSAYVALNIVFARCLDRYAPIVWRRAVQPLRAIGERQLRRISARRIWGTVLIQTLAIVIFGFFLVSPQSLFTMTLGIASYVLFVCAINVSLLARLPVVLRVWQDPSSRLFTWAAPIAIVYVAKGYASAWVGSVIGVSAANAPFALLAATASMVALVVAFLLVLLSLLFEVAMLFAPSLDLKGRGKRRLGLSILSVIGFFSAVAASTAAFQLPTTRLGSPLISAIAFEFDAAPAQPCRLVGRETDLASGDEPFLRALYLASSQEKALLIRREPALFRSFVLADLKPEEAKEKRVAYIRMVECFYPELKLGETR